MYGLCVVEKLDWPQPPSIVDNSPPHWSLKPGLPYLDYLTATLYSTSKVAPTHSIPYPHTPGTTYPYIPGQTQVRQWLKLKHLYYVFVEQNLYLNRLLTVALFWQMNGSQSAYSELVDGAANTCELGILNIFTWCLFQVELNIFEK